MQHGVLFTKTIYESVSKSSRIIITISSKVDRGKRTSEETCQKYSLNSLKVAKYALIIGMCIACKNVSQYILTLTTRIVIFWDIVYVMAISIGL